VTPSCGQADLAAAVQAQVDRLTDELDRLRCTTADDAAGEDAHITVRLAVSVDPIGDNIDQALARITAVSDQDDQVLQTITQDLIAGPPSQAVVPDNPPDNPQTGPITPDNLASLRQAAETAAEKGDSRQAVGMYASLAAASPRLLGPEHPDTLSVRNNLARWRGSAGDAEGAVVALAELLPVSERVRGPEHPDTLSVRNNLARWRRR
jgi:hypothetical protein